VPISNVSKFINPAKLGNEVILLPSKLRELSITRLVVILEFISVIPGLKERFKLVNLSREEIFQIEFPRLLYDKSKSTNSVRSDICEGIAESSLPEIRIQVTLSSKFFPIRLSLKRLCGVGFVAAKLEFRLISSCSAIKSLQAS
jgi:hypothetical protein